MTFKRGFLFALIPVIVLAAIFNKLVYYGFVQARGQLEIVFNSIPVKEVLAIEDLSKDVYEVVSKSLSDNQ